MVDGATDSTYTNGATVVCDTAANTGTITIPPYALLALPAGNFGRFQFRQQTAGAFTAQGLYLGQFQTGNAPTQILGFTLK